MSSRTASVQRRGRGRPFEPGTSGNPKGRPRDSLAEAIREKWPPEKLVEVVSRHAKAKNKFVAQRAIEWLTDRGYGKAPETIDLNVGGQLAHVHVHAELLGETHVERKRRLEELRQKAAGALPAPAIVDVPASDDADEG